MTHARKLRNAATSATLAMLVIGSVLPLIWVGLTSLKDPRQFFSQAMTWWPQPPTLVNFYSTVGKHDGWQLLANSVIVASASALLATAAALPICYWLARFPKGPQRSLAMFLLALHLVPVLVLALPAYLLKAYFNLPPLLVVIATHALMSTPIAAWILQPFIAGLPPDIEAAAHMDGASFGRIMAQIVLPNLWSGLAVAAFLAAVASWNEYLLAGLLTGLDSKTLPVLIATFFSVSPTDSGYGEGAAAAFIGLGPAVLAATLLFRSWEKDQTNGFAENNGG